MAMIECSDLLREYSDYKDGLMAPSRAASVETHLRRCSSCARYHTVVVRGIEEFRSLPGIEPSSDFLGRLQHRLYDDQAEMSMWARRDSSMTSVGLVVLLVLLIGAVSWVPVLQVDTARVNTARMELPPAVAIAPPTPSPVLFRAAPLLSPSPPYAIARPASNSFFIGHAAVGTHVAYRPPPLLTPR